MKNNNKNNKIPITISPAANTLDGTCSERAVLTRFETQLAINSSICSDEMNSKLHLEYHQQQTRWMGPAANTLFFTGF